MVVAVAGHEVIAQAPIVFAWPGQDFPAYGGRCHGICCTSPSSSSRPTPSLQPIQPWATGTPRALTANSVRIVGAFTASPSMQIGPHSSLRPRLRTSRSHSH